MMGYFNRYIALLGCISLACLVGCGGGDSNVGLVTGTLKVDGEAVENAVVYFQPTGGGRASRGSTNAEGIYELAYTRDQMGAVIGEHKVWFKTEVERYTDYENDGKTVKGRKELLPRKYTESGTTELKETVQSGNNAINFDLETK